MYERVLTTCFVVFLFFILLSFEVHIEHWKKSDEQIKALNNKITLFKVFLELLLILLYKG
jgi:hypothetical protein